MPVQCEQRPGRTQQLFNAPKKAVGKTWNQVPGGYAAGNEVGEHRCEVQHLDLQTRMQHWLHGWLLFHVPLSFLLLLLTVWHAFVTLFHY